MSAPPPLTLTFELLATLESSGCQRLKYPRQVLLAEYTTIKQSVWMRGNKAQSFSTKRRRRKKREKNYKVEFPLVVVEERGGGDLATCEGQWESQTAR